MYSRRILTENRYAIQIGFVHTMLICVAGDRGGGYGAPAGAAGGLARAAVARRPEGFVVVAQRSGPRRWIDLTHARRDTAFTRRQNCKHQSPRHVRFYV